MFNVIHNCFIAFRDLTKATNSHAELEEQVQELTEENSQIATLRAELFHQKGSLAGF